MTTVFKRNIGGREYVFYRALLVNDVVYFAVTGSVKERNTIKLTKDNNGYWIIENHWALPSVDWTLDFVEAVVYNEKGFDLQKR